MRVVRAAPRFVTVCVRFTQVMYEHAVPLSPHKGLYSVQAKRRNTSQTKNSATCQRPHKPCFEVHEHLVEKTIRRVWCVYLHVYTCAMICMCIYM